VPVRGKPLATPSDGPTPLGGDELPIAAKPVAPTRDERLTQMLAELEASKKRLEREAEREREQVRADLVRQLLPVLDNLDRSIDASSHSADEALRDGVKMVRAQFEQVLQGFGMEVLDARGAPFDPAEHEAVAMVPVQTPQAHRTVVSVVRPGYRLDGRLLRAAQVTVGDHREPEAEAGTEDGELSQPSPS
jgi:molecular chaperone GrpE